MVKSLRQSLFWANLLLIVLIQIIPVDVSGQANYLHSITQQPTQFVSSQQPSLKAAQTTSVPTTEASETTDTIVSKTSTPSTDCGWPSEETVLNSEFTPGNTSLGSTIIYSCKDGYTPQGYGNVTCQADGNWTMAELTCIMQDCGSPSEETVENSVVTSGNTTFGSTAIYLCIDGYTPEGNGTVTCQANGNWTLTDLVCIIKDCGTPAEETVQNSVVTPDNTTFGSTAIYSCIDGYEPQGYGTVTCQADGSWTMAELKCIIEEKAHNEECSLDEQCTTTNSSCESKGEGTGTCVCSEYDFFKARSNSCENRVEYDRTCDISENATNQCNTSNAICLMIDSMPGGRCLCNDTLYFQKEEDACKKRPTAPMKILIFRDYNRIKETNLQISWSRPTNEDTGFTAELEWNPPSSGGQNTTCIPWDFGTPQSPSISGLQPGTNYTFYLFLRKNSIGERTELLDSVCFFTKPSKVQNVTFANISEKSIVVSWLNDQDQPDVYYNVSVNDGENVTVARNNSTYEQFELNYFIDEKDLTGGTQYNFSIVAVVPHQVSNASVYRIYTSPEPVTNASISELHSNTVELELNFLRNTKRDGYRIYVSPAPYNQKNYTETENDYVNITGLTPGRMYEFTVYSFLIDDEKKRISDRYVCISAYTRPLPPENITTVTISETSVKLQSRINKNNLFENLILQYKVEDAIQFNTEYLNKTFIFEYEVCNLTSGTEYEFNLYSTANGTHTWSEDPARIYVYTIPSQPPEPYVQGRTDTSISIQFPYDSNNYERYKINETFYDRENIDGNQTIVITDLSPGEEFYFTIFTVVNSNITSFDNVTFNSFTLPAPPDEAYFPLNDLHEESLTVMWNATTKGYFDGYELHLMSGTENITKYNASSETTAHFSNLTAGENYTVIIFSYWRGFLSYSNLALSTYTRPSAPSVELTHVSKTSFTFSIEGDLRDGYTYVLETTSIESQNLTVNFVDTEGQIHTIEKLTAGTLYNIYIYAIIGGIVGENPHPLQSYTEPNSVDEDVITADEIQTNSSMLAIKWNKPNGSVSWYEISFNCVSPNDARDLEEKFNERTNLTESNVGGLDPGTMCSVNITTHVGNQTGDVTTKQIDYSTDEKAPEEVENIQITTKARSLEVTWTPPLTRNGVVRKYVVDVLDTDNGCCVSRAVYSCNDCGNMSNEQCMEAVPVIELPSQDCADAPFVNETGQFSQADNYSHSVENLQPFKNYTVVITPFTRCFGKNSSVSKNTEEATPDGAPRNIIKHAEETTKDTLVFSWMPPANDLQNGKIINYTITIMYYNQTCYSDEVGEIVTETLYASRVNSSGMNKYEIGELFPYWSYNVSVAAWTEVGEGIHSTPSLMMTNQSNPGPIRNAPTTANVSSSRVSLNWVHPCLVNGVIDHYQIKIYSDNNDNVTIAKSNPKTDSNDTSFVVTGLYPYHNYSFSVTAVNELGYVGSPINTSEITRTKTGQPYEPTNVTAKAISPTELKINWVLPSLYTGVTNYTITATDTIDNTIQKCSKIVHNFYQTEAIVGGLDEYWNYTLTVTAITSAGNTTSAVSTEASTLPSVPGVVENVDLHNETNITLPRSIRVTWDKPTTRNLNGILRNYFITYTADLDPIQAVSTAYGSPINRLPFVLYLQKGQCRLVKMQCPKAVVVVNDPSIGEVVNKTINISANTEILRHNRTISNIKPGNYSVAVYAATEQGLGIVVKKNIIIYPGAPLIIKESASDPLMKKSNDTSVVNDTRTQIAIQIPLKFLCDDSNGKPNQFGIVIAANTETTNDTYNGDTEGFSSWKKLKYKSWFQVHNQTNPKPYITSYPNWNPCQGVITGQRKRRSTGTTSDVFVIGADGKCSGKSTNEYCNGELRPGTSYRFKAYTCTMGGCTETRYSKTVETQKVESPSQSKVPAIVGAVSACVVFILVIIIVVQMRRRQAACFAKKAEEGNTHRRSEPIPATEMSRVDRPTSVRYKPESVRLSEFPDYVDRLKKDSLLILSDLYKLLKEKSPRHSCSVAESQICRPKNRYTNILPFDHSRVKILPLDDEEGSDYINANYIPGYTSRREYIATQGPMPATYDDFWRMVWEQNVEIIVMLTKLMEKGRNKCDKYWPNQGEPQFYGDLSLSIISESNLSDYTIRIMEIKLKGEKRKVKQFSFLKWPDMGCPEYPESLLEFVKNVRQHQSKTERDRPIVVHCSAGVGRTGTFIAVDHLLQHIRDHDEIDIYNLVLEMRNNRCNMVQTEDQFVYIHECIREFITNDDDEEDYDDEDENLYANTRQENVYENTGFSKQF